MGACGLWAGAPCASAAWVSSRGEAWSEVALPPAAAGDTSWHLGLVATSGATTVMADNLPGQPYVLVRKDGAWSEPSAGGVFGSPLTTAVPTSLVSDNGSLVMSVQLTDPGQALGGGTSSVAVLASPDGQTWQTSNVDAFDDASVSQLLPVQGGLLAVGSARARSPAGEGRGAFANLSNDLGVTWPGTGINPGGLGDGSQGAVAAGRLGRSEYVVGRQGARAVEWYSPAGTRWQEPQPLDPSPQLGVEQPLAACSGPDSAVVVGSVTRTARGSLPAAWVSDDGLNWLNATITPSQPTGASSSIEGCLFTGNSFIAYGGTTGRGQAEQPAIWASPDGSVWQQQPSDFAGLDGHGPVGLQAAPLDEIAYGGTTWVGVSGAGDLPSEQWPTPVGGSASATPVAAGLWDSTDAGSTWQQLGTGAAPFAGVLYAQADQATYVGQQPVVAGFVDGQLAVWVGTPTAAGGS